MDVQGLVPTMIIVYAALGNTIDSSAWTAARSNSDPTRSPHFASDPEPPSNLRSHPQQERTQQRQIRHHESLSDSKGSCPVDETIEIGRLGLSIGYIEDECGDHDHANRADCTPQFNASERSEGDGRDTENLAADSIVTVHPVRARSFEHTRHNGRDLERGSMM